MIKDMKATDLRIGNWVYYNDKPISIPPSALIEFYYLGDTHANSKTDRRSYAPIPITEEWLLKLGFKRPEGKSYFAQEGDLDSEYACIRISDVYKNGKYSVSIGDDECGVLFRHFQYVHDLQNLFYAIDNKDLTPTKPNV